MTVMHETHESRTDRHESAEILRLTAVCTVPDRDCELATINTAVQRRREISGLGCHPLCPLPSSSQGSRSFYDV